MITGVSWQDAAATSALTTLINIVNDTGNSLAKAISLGISLNNQTWKTALRSKRFSVVLADVHIFHQIPLLHCIATIVSSSNLISESVGLWRCAIEAFIDPLAFGLHMLFRSRARTCLSALYGIAVSYWKLVAFAASLFLLEACLHVRSHVIIRPAEPLDAHSIRAVKTPFTTLPHAHPPSFSC